MRYEESNRPANMYELIPFAEALAAYRKLQPQQTARKAQPSEYSSARDTTAEGAVVCKTCSSPWGTYGFIRMSFPSGHTYFGKPICCPTCWPAPFGMAPRGALSQRAQQIAQMWEAYWSQAGHPQIERPQPARKAQPVQAHWMER